MRRRRAGPERCPEAAAENRRRRVEDPVFQPIERESRRLNARRRRESDPGLRLLDNFQHQARRDMGWAKLGTADRLWFDVNLSTMNSVRNYEQRSSALQVLREAFPDATDHDEMKGKLPQFSTTNGFVYPPKPSSLPRLNDVEERMVAPRIPFMNIRRLTHGAGQYGIRGQVINVPIDVQQTVKSLPRSVPNDAAIHVHLKRRLLAKPVYKAGVVTKNKVYAWLEYWWRQPLYRFYGVEIQWEELGRIPEEAGPIDDEDIGPGENLEDLNDPVLMA
ncbi:hypothetical protein HPB48_019227 [Haemaphysalis longicornis]|uniref:DUF6570 domain-containing protein n=1 Tax=Haemaphysalis longicornis TaxID=44386 RepID=A0A9J6GCN5_HAELO|nr:hypothetical protein HPB48_019227 [Haemaphysalis longicornis]